MPEIKTQKYLQNLKECRRSYKTYTGYHHALNRCNMELKNGGFTTEPELIGKTEIGYLMECFEPLAVATRHWYIAIFGQYLEFYNNRILKEMRIMWPQDWRLNADWLSPEQATYLVRCATRPEERLCIALELFMGLRRIEVLRLSMKDIDMKRSKMNVCGKGSNGGKWRSVYIPNDAKDAINAWLPIREELINEVLELNPAAAVPDKILIYTQKTEIKTYGEKGTGYDKAIIYPVKERSGVDFSNHTLRRTFGRSCWLAGVKIETISNILGHEDLCTTIKYLGVQMDDQKTAMEEVSKWRQKIEEQA